MNLEQFNESQLLTIHCDGRVTVGDKLKPEETAKLVLDIIKTQWLEDAQAKMIRELQDWKESALAVEREWDANAISTMLGGKPGESQRKVIQREVPRLLDRIKRLEEELLHTKYKYSALIADVVLYEDREVYIKQLEEVLNDVKSTREHADYKYVCRVKAILKGEEIDGKEAKL